MSSYGPVVALSNLSNNLSNTLASGERVLSLLEEKPKVTEVISDTDQKEKGKENKKAKKKAKKKARQDENQEEKHSEKDGDENAVSEKLDIEITDARPEMQMETTGEATDIDTDVDTTPVSYIQNIHGIALENIYFSYGGKFVLQDMSMNIKGGQITAIHGPSGSGKSTILKLLMRFYDPQDGKVIISEAIGKDYDIKTIQSDTLRNMESYVTQETWLFHDTIRRNIEIGSLGATDEEIYEAAKKASIHDYIISLPNGYDTMIGESGDTLSDGERQRIGVARAFLHNAPVMILDEPTSNLDALNEGIILSSLEEEKERSIILVSHRKSTVSIADKVFVSE
ncbi:MAG: ATP-binding cassette domain-containing protein [Eubacterium sp.]|nr:ATP-binding cassette domain-containing protein [Eubacterium sp.]